MDAAPTEFVPLVVLAEPALIDATHGPSILRGIVDVTIGAVRAMAVFTTPEFAREYQDNHDLTALQPVTFLTGIEFCEFLLQQKLDGVTQLAFDPFSKGLVQIVEIDEVIDKITSTQRINDAMDEPTL